MGDELAHEVGDRRPGPGDPALALRKRRWRSRGSSASRSWSWRTKSSLLAQRLDRVEQPEAGAAHPGRDARCGRRPRRARGAGLGDLLGDPERQRAAGVDRAAEGDEAVDPLAAPVGGGLVAEHAALGVAAEVDVAAGLGAHPVDRLGDREHVVGEGALEAALLVLGGAEVDDPRIDAVRVQDRDGAGGGETS